MLHTQKHIHTHLKKTQTQFARHTERDGDTAESSSFSELNFGSISRPLQGITHSSFSRYYLLYYYILLLLLRLVFVYFLSRFNNKSVSHNHYKYLYFLGLNLHFLLCSLLRVKTKKKITSNFIDLEYLRMCFDFLRFSKLNFVLFFLERH